MAVPVSGAGRAIDLGMMVDGAFQWCLDQRLITRVTVRDEGPRHRVRIIEVAFPAGYTREFAITAEELANGEVARWLAVVMDEIGREQTRDWRAGAMRAAEQSEMKRLRAAALNLTSGMDVLRGAFLGATEDNLAFAREFGGFGDKADEAAEKKAEALFIRAAGQAAHDALEREEDHVNRCVVSAETGLAVKGSVGGDYLLHKKRSYCVTRVSDGARLCAVVPGVPLWDHLLGIKLTIEHDEPEFLRKANVAGASVRVQRSWSHHGLFPIGSN